MISFKQQTPSVIQVIPSVSQVAVLKQRQKERESGLEEFPQFASSTDKQWHVAESQVTCIQCLYSQCPAVCSKTWAVIVDDIHRLVRNDNAMVTWICSAKLCEKIPMLDLRTRMSISSIEDLIRYNRLRQFAHLQRMDDEK